MEKMLISILTAAILVLESSETGVVIEQKLDKYINADVKSGIEEVKEKSKTSENIAIESENETEELEDTKNRDLSQFEGMKLLAFTFDDGPNGKITEKLLDGLDEHNARVTFFVVGNRVNSQKDTLLKAYEQGNQIGSHTYNHSNLLKLWIGYNNLDKKDKDML